MPFIPLLTKLFVSRKCVRGLESWLMHDQAESLIVLMFHRVTHLLIGVKMFYIATLRVGILWIQNV